MPTLLLKQTHAAIGILAIGIPQKALKGHSKVKRKIQKLQEEGFKETHNFSVDLVIFFSDKH